MPVPLCYRDFSKWETIWEDFLLHQIKPYPRSRLGGPHPRSGQGGTPIQVSEWGYPVYPHPRLDGMPPPGQDGEYPILLTGGTPIQDQDGGTPSTPPSKTGWCTPLPSRTGWGTSHPRLDGVPPISKASTCYVAGGVSLTFTQRTFLLLSFYIPCLICVV